ncbi:MAG: hypothetical protein ACXVIY_01800 [Mucilaginibacter sp.]
MFKKLLLSAILAVLLFSVAQAQDDSLYYDLGRVLVRKSDTKTTSIKGVDLEKYQASNLSDAINVWLNGTYSTSASIVYVIDGNILTDVNVYSIFDIDEVTLVETATAQASGAGPGREMVLIKLRTDRSGSHGLEVNGQTSLVNVRDNAGSLAAASATAHTSVYNNYYIAWYKNYKKVRMGVTTEYQRDVDPKNSGYGLEFLQPSSFDRFKMNAYLTANLWKGTTLSFGASYLPQTNRYAFNHDSISSFDGSPLNTNHSTRVSQHLFNTDLSIKSDIAKGLTNRLSVAYAHSNYLEKDQFNYSYVSGGTAYASDSAITNVNRSHNLLFRDYLVYHGKLGDFDIQPTLNMTYRHALDTTNYFNTITSKFSGFPDEVFEYPASARTLARRFMMTPSIDINLKDIFDFQGGFVTVLNSIKDTSATAHISHIYPFVSTSVNLARLVGITFVDWGLFASYSKQGAVLADESTTLYGFNGAVNPGAIAFIPGDPNLQHHNDSYQLGTEVGIFKNFSVSYNYAYKYYTTYIDQTIQTDNGPVTRILPVNSRVVTTYVTAHYSVRSSKFSWITSLTGTESHLQALDTAIGNRFNATYLSQGHRWSGGMTHRFTYANVFGGVDLLYQVGERPENLVYVIDGTPGGLPPLNNNSFTIQNIYFGVRVKAPYLKFMELYASGRNIAQTQSSTITDNRRFYGLGFKAGF